MGSGSAITSSNDDASYAKANHKQKLIDTGTIIRATVPTGGGQEAYSNDDSASMIYGQDYQSDASGTLWQSKQSTVFWLIKYGHIQPISTTAADNENGLWNNSTVSGTLGMASLDTTEGLAATYTSGASAGNQAGQKVDRLYTIRNFNPSFKLNWKTDEAGANIRFFAGWVDSTTLIGNSDDPLNAINGFGVAMVTSQANYRILSNDGVGATSPTDTGVVKDTGWHSIELWADANSNSFYWSIDSATPIQKNTEIPAATTSLACQFTVTAVNADAKVLSVQNCLINSDR